MCYNRFESGPNRKKRIFSEKLIPIEKYLWIRLQNYCTIDVGASGTLGSIDLLHESSHF